VAVICHVSSGHQYVSGNSAGSGAEGSLPIDAYSFVEEARKIHKLDFDDSYQYGLARFYDLVLVSMDQDFRKIDDPKILLF
jgi:predicted nucleic acid-binding protein